MGRGAGITLIWMMAVTATGYAGEGQKAAVEECNIEAINGVPFSTAPASVAGDTAVTLSGWVVDRRSGRVPLNLNMRFTPAAGVPVEIQVKHRIFRPDVADNFRNNAYLIAGFKLTVPPLTLARGRWRMSMAYSVDGRDVGCDNGRSVEITERSAP
jgi:hypothetical protein